MTRLARVISAIGPLRILLGLGSLLVVLGAWRSILLVLGGVSIVAAIDGFILTAVPGGVLLYGRHWLAKSDIPAPLYPRIIAWCFGGIFVILGVVALIEFDPIGSGIERPFFTVLLAVAIGSSGGFAIGVHEARAVFRAREAEEHRDRFLAERDLRERIADTSPVGITVVNADRSMRMTNERAAEIVGLPRDDFLDLEYDESMLETTDGAGNPLERGVFERVMQTGEAVYDVERKMTRPDGERIWLSVSGAPLEEPKGVIFAFQDITERKQLEQDLTETVRRLEQSNDRLRQFAYIASHDLQEPLRMVSSFLQLLENRYADELDQEAREFIDFAVDGAARMRDMIDDLLAFSRLQQEDYTLELVDCNAVIENVLADLHVQIEKDDAEVTYGSLPTVHGNETHLEQLFQNLIANALKYNDSQHPRIHIKAEQRSDQWLFSVIDNGIGIDPEHTDQIFEIFNRLHSRSDYPGTGIGLSLCQEIINQHGGDIWVESEPGEGSEFYFTLPILQDHEQPTTQQSTS